MIFEELKSRKNFVEEDFIELRDSVEELISVIEKYKDMRYNSSLYIDDLKEFLADINLSIIRIDLSLSFFFVLFVKILLILVAHS